MTGSAGEDAGYEYCRRDSPSGSHTEGPSLMGNGLGNRTSENSRKQNSVARAPSRARTPARTVTTAPARWTSSLPTAMDFTT